MGYVTVVAKVLNKLRVAAGSSPIFDVTVFCALTDIDVEGMTPSRLPQSLKVEADGFEVIQHNAAIRHEMFSMMSSMLEVGEKFVKLYKTATNRDLPPL